MKKFRKCPKVNKTRQAIHFCIDLDLTSREELIKLLVEAPNNYYFHSDYDGGVFLKYSVKETDTQMKDRIAKESEQVLQWKQEYADWLAKQEEDKRAKAAAKEAYQAKFQDPEYIDFLRLQSKMKEKGYI